MKTEQYKIIFSEMQVILASNKTFLTKLSTLNLLHLLQLKIVFNFITQKKLKLLWFTLSQTCHSLYSNYNFSGNTCATDSGNGQLLPHSYWASWTTVRVHCIRKWPFSVLVARDDNPKPSQGVPWSRNSTLSPISTTSWIWLHVLRLFISQTFLYLVVL